MADHPPVPQPPAAKGGSSLGKILLFGGGALLILCVGCLVFFVILGMVSEDTPTTESPEVAQDSSPVPAAEVEVSQPTSAPLPTAVPTVSQSGLSASDPILVGSAMTVDGNAITVTLVQRGAPVNAMVEQANMFNTDPESNQEYLLVEISSQCTNDDNCSLAYYSFAVTGANGIVYDPQPLITGVEGVLDSVEYLPGATVTGKLFFIVGLGETNLVMKFAPLFTFSQPSEAYFRVE